MPLAQVRDLLGHASITTTERYDNQTVADLKIAAAKLERGHAFAPSARTKFQDSFKIAVSDAGSDTPRAVPAIEANELADLNLGDWLGVGDGIRNLADYGGVITPHCSPFTVSYFEASATPAASWLSEMCIQISDRLSRPEQGRLRTIGPAAAPMITTVQAIA